MEELEYTQDNVRKNAYLYINPKAGLGQYLHFRLFLLSAILLKSANLDPPSLL